MFLYAKMGEPDRLTLPLDIVRAFGVTAWHSKSGSQTFKYFMCKYHLQVSTLLGIVKLFP